MSEYLIPTNSSHPTAIVAGPDGALWFTESNTNKIGRISTSGVFKEYTTPTSSSQPESITAGPDGALWFTESNTNRIGRITTAGVITEFTVPTSNSDPHDIVAGPDGALWFTENNSNKIGRITTGGSFTEFSIPTSNSHPWSIATGSDGALWFTESGTNKIGQLTTAGVFTEYTIPTSGSQPEGIASGPDGALWFTEHADPANNIGRVTTTGAFTEYTIPLTKSKPIDITTGSDGALWFTLSDGHANAIGRLTVGGTMTEYTIPTSNSTPYGITAGPDGAIWFTENGTNKIGRVLLDQPLTATGTAIQATEQTPFNGTVATFTDADTAAPASSYKVTIGWGDGTTSIGTVTGGDGQFQITGTHTYAAPGSFTVTVTIQDLGYTGGDSGGASATTTTTILVADAPLAASGSGQTLTATEGAGTGMQVVATFTDPGSDGTTTPYTATIQWGDGSTASGIIVPLSGNTFEVVGSHTYTDAGSDVVQVSIQDSGGSNLTVSQTTFQVSDAALTASAVSASATEGAAFNGNVATFTDANPYSKPTDFTATIDWGDGTTSTGNVSANGQGGFAVYGNHTYTEDGTYAVRVMIADTDGSTASVLSAMSVADAPLTGTGLTINTSLGILLSNPVATFTDADPNGQASQYMAQVDWGDGFISPGTVTASSAGGFEVNGSHLYLFSGSYDVTVIAQDVGGASVTMHGVVNVGGLAVTGLDLSTLEGASWSGTVVAFNNPQDPTTAAGQYTATIDWGDGNTSAGTVVADGNGGFYVQGAHTYAETGSYTATVVVQCTTSGLTGTATDAVQVSDAPLAASSQTISSTEGALFSGVIASFTDSNPSAAATDYSVTIDWGDGTRSTGTVSAGSSSGFNVSGDHVYADEGTYSIAVAIDDVGGATVSTTSTAQVSDAPLSATPVTISTTEGATFQGSVFSFRDANPSSSLADFTATIDWGDGTSSNGTILSTGTGMFNVVGSHTYAEEGNEPITVTVSDRGGQRLVATSTAQVADAPLTVTSLSYSATEGQSFQGAVAALTDADPLGSAQDYTPLIHWGDGASSVGTVVANGPGSFIIEGNHTYAEDGGYVITVSVTDAGGSVAQASATTFVADAALSSSGFRLSASPGVRTTETVARFVDLNPASVVADYRAIIAWGDRTSSAGTVAADGRGGFIVLGSKTYGTTGTYIVHVLILDRDGSSTRARSTVTVVANAAGGSSTPPAQSSGPIQTQAPPQLPIAPPAPDAPAPTPVLTLIAEMLASPVDSFSSSSDASISTASLTSSRATQVTPLAHSASDNSGDSGNDKDVAGHAAAPSNLPIRPSPVVAVPPSTPTPPAPAQVATTTPSPATPRGLNSRPVMPSRPSPHLETPQLTQALDQLKHDVEQTRQRPQWAIDAVFATGVATAGYVALTSRAAGWLMTALLSRPLWREFDPIEILFAWEAERKERTSGADDDETLQSLVSKND